MYELAVLKQHEGKSGEALTLLREAITHGLHSDDTVRMETDPEFKELHGDPRFEALIADAQKRAAAASNTK